MGEQIVSCYNCKSGESSLYDIENGFRYVKCKGCGLVYLEQLPDEKEIAYWNTFADEVIEETGKRAASPELYKQLKELIATQRAKN